MARDDITGLVLAGGRGSRMGGVDKGLQRHRGMPLALHALQRLAPQVGRVAINANRHLDAYAAFGAPVWPDALPEHPGPLAGFLAGLAHIETPWLATVPCDSPNFPADLVARLADALARQGGEIAMAVSVEAGGRRAQPVFCLLHRALATSLRESVAAGERKVERWATRHGCVEVPFDDAAAFVNANTPAELQRLQG
ncbi:MAG: molybdenum cofactor guanylyltransferase MobA [Piscinibacter sp.]